MAGRHLGRRCALDARSRRQLGNVIQLHGATSIANYLHDYYADTPAVTQHRFGQGGGYYVGTMLDEAGLNWLIDQVIVGTGVRVSPATPIGVELIQRSDATHTWLFALNYSAQPVEIALERSARDLITGTAVDKSIRLGPVDVAIIQSGRL